MTCKIILEVIASATNAIMVVIFAPNDSGAAPFDGGTSDISVIEKKIQVANKLRPPKIFRQRLKLIVDGYIRQKIRMIAETLRRIFPRRGSL
jgi:hypothetical protein